MRLLRPDESVKRQHNCASASVLVSSMHPCRRGPGQKKACSVSIHARLHFRSSLEAACRLIYQTFHIYCGIFSPGRRQASPLPQEESCVIAYSRRNAVEEQREACQKAQQLTALYEQFQITLDPIDWQQFELWAPVKVNTIEIAFLRDLWQRDRNDLLRQVQMNLLEYAALETLRSRPGLKAVIWSPVEVIQPQSFLSLWLITLETDEPIPIVESLRNGRRVYEPFQFDGADEQQLAAFFGLANGGEYHLDEVIPIKEREHQYSGEIIYILPPNKMLPDRNQVARRYRTVSRAAYTDAAASRYMVDCHDGFPHIAYQPQAIW